jgi:K+-sensing histidine kinase KdpD
MKEDKSDKEQFFSKISHDLRGSFTSILGFSDILNDPTENLTEQEIKDFVNRIGKQSHESFDLLVNFVNWLKLENYNYGLVNEKLQILDSLIEIKSNQLKGIINKNLKFNFNIDENAFVFMDYEILSAILNNIFTFLIKISCENSIISFKTFDTNDKFLTIDILADCKGREYSLLQNIDLRDLGNELSFPIVFAIKFVEQSGGMFNFSVDDKNNLFISIKLPKE